MSFYMDVEIDDLTWERAVAIARRCSSADGLSIVKPRRGLFGGFRSSKLVIADDWGGESILADDADWNAPAWSMRKEALPKLEVSLRCLCKYIPEGFGFVAAWVSDPIEQEQEVSSDELIELVRRSGLNGRTRYRVKQSGKPMPEELDLSQEETIVIGYVTDLYRLLRAIDQAMPNDAILYIEGTNIAAEITTFLGAQHVQEWKDIVPHTGWPSPKTFHLSLDGTNLKELCEIADRHAEPEVCDHLVVYRKGEVILKAHDAGSGYVEVNRKLPTDTIERVKEELQDVIRKRR